MQKVAELVQKLNALSFELERSKKGDLVTLSLILEKVSMSTLEDLKKSLGSSLIRLDCLPHMMHELLLEIEYKP